MTRKDREELARNMLRGQHSVAFTAAHTELPPKVVRELAERMEKARQIPKVRP